MACFSNGCEGEVFDAQCAKCKYFEQPCPIAWVQFNYNYDQIGNELPRKILNCLVKQDGTCTMWEMCRKDFEIDPNQTNLFEGT